MEAPPRRRVRTCMKHSYIVQRTPPLYQRGIFQYHYHYIPFPLQLVRIQMLEI